MHAQPLPLLKQLQDELASVISTYPTKATSWRAWQVSAQLWQIPESPHVLQQKRGNDAFLLFTGDEEGLAAGLVVLVIEKVELIMVAFIRLIWYLLWLLCGLLLLLACCSLLSSCCGSIAEQTGTVVGCSQGSMLCCNVSFWSRFWSSFQAVWNGWFSNLFLWWKNLKKGSLSVTFFRIAMNVFGSSPAKCGRDSMMSTTSSIVVGIDSSTAKTFALRDNENIPSILKNECLLLWSHELANDRQKLRMSSWSSKPFLMRSSKMSILIEMFIRFIFESKMRIINETLSVSQVRMKCDVTASRSCTPWRSPIWEAKVERVCSCRLFSSKDEITWKTCRSWRLFAKVSEKWLIIIVWSLSPRQ